jgi:hypothetical protein
MATTRAVRLPIAAVCAVVLLLAACGGATGTPTPTATQPTPTPTPTATALGTPTPSATRAACGPMSGGLSARARITDMRIETTIGHDTLVIQFDTAVTRYQLSQNPTGVQFAGSGGKGGTFTLNGTYGLRLNILNLNWSESPGDQYPHGTDLRQSAPTLQEVRQIGDLEGTANIAIGLSSNVCPRVSILSGPPRLVLELPSS